MYVLKLKVPIAPMGKWLTCLPRLPLQQLRPTHRSTTACTCRRDLQCFPSPRWEEYRRACFDSRLHNCESRFGQLQDVREAETLKTSHRPDGIFTCFGLVLAGWRCLHPWWHGDLVILHHHWQHSYICACSRSKFPIDGKLTFCSLFAGRRCLCRLSKSWHSNHIIVHHQ